MGVWSCDRGSEPDPGMWGRITSLTRTSEGTTVMTHISVTKYSHLAITNAHNVPHEARTLNCINELPDSRAPVCSAMLSVSPIECNEYH